MFYKTLYSFVFIRSAYRLHAGSGGSEPLASRQCVAQDGKSQAEAFFRVLGQGKDESREESRPLCRVCGKDTGQRILHQRPVRARLLR